MGCMVNRFSQLPFSLKRLSRAPHLVNAGHKDCGKWIRGHAYEVKLERLKWLLLSDVMSLLTSLPADPAFTESQVVYDTRGWEQKQIA